MAKLPATMSLPSVCHERRRGARRASVAERADLPTTNSNYLTAPLPDLGVDRDGAPAGEERRERRGARRAAVADRDADDAVRLPAPTARVGLGAVARRERAGRRRVERAR